MYFIFSLLAFALLVFAFSANNRNGSALFSPHIQIAGIFVALSLRGISHLLTNIIDIVIIVLSVVVVYNLFRLSRIEEKLFIREARTGLLSRKVSRKDRKC